MSKNESPTRDRADATETELDQTDTSLLAKRDELPCEWCGQSQARTVRSLHQATCPQNPAIMLSLGTAGTPSQSADSRDGFTGSDDCSPVDETVGVLEPGPEVLSHASPATGPGMRRAEPAVISRRRATGMTAVEKEAYYKSAEGQEKRRQRTLRITRQAEEFMDGRCGAPILRRSTSCTTMVGWQWVDGRGTGPR